MIENRKLYAIWNNMKRRCENPKMPSYRWYGGRGIRVCPEWHSFQCFEKWALSNGYAEGLSIDRIDNDGNYEPANCQWISSADNTRKAAETIISVDGVEGNLRAWATLLDCTPSVISYHMNGNGQSVEDFIREKASGNKKRVLSPSTVITEKRTIVREKPDKNVVKAVKQMNRRIEELAEAGKRLQEELTAIRTTETVENLPAIVTEHRLASPQKLAA
ncbi:hypothetical protein [Bifidobacterium sp. SO1]|uniref:hypothetical protein n=1 Tax=Bifidobacterium sp. SO1 TaxID=2809029 RepID=UPI001BDD87EE|nr:hypothetical protein [Bifidobacterium sp. SO1]MBT1161282.1 hypothetical protein [Bifidobacterium sp. SO1]